MPQGNATGPNGLGPMTGRGLGACSGSAVNTPCGRGRGGGRGMFARGFGMFRGMFPVNQGNIAPVNPENEKELLKNQATILKEQLDNINKRIDTLDA